MVDPAAIAGVLITLGAAIASAVNQLLIRVGTERGAAYDAVFIVMAVNLVVLTPLVGIYYYPNYGLTPVAWLSFGAAGLFGTLLGRLSVYVSIDRIGASRTSPIVSANALVATVLGVAVLGESLTPLHAVGVVLIVSGVGAIAWETSHENPDDLPRRELLLSLLVPFVGVLAFGLEPILVSFGLRTGTPAPVGLVVRTVVATLGFVAYLRWRNALPTGRTLRSTTVRWFVLAGLANTVFVLGYYVALAIAPVNVVVPIIITQTLWVVLLSAVVMPERLEAVTWKLVGAAAVVVAGAVFVTLSA